MFENFNQVDENGLAQGTYYWYFSKHITIENYIDNELNGEYYVTTHDDEIRIKGQYKKGIEVGLWWHNYEGENQYSYYL